MSSFNLSTTKKYGNVYNPWRFSKSAGETIILQNHSASAVWVALDDASLSADSGYEVAAGGSWRAPRNFAGEVYIIGVAGGALQDIRVLSDVNVTVEVTPFIELWTTPIDFWVDMQTGEMAWKHRCHGRFGSDQGSAIDTALVVDISSNVDETWGEVVSETPKFWDGSAMTAQLTVNPYGPGVGESSGPSVYSGTGPPMGSDWGVYSAWENWCAYLDTNTYEVVEPGFADIVVDAAGNAFGNATGGDAPVYMENRIVLADISGFATGSVFEGMTVTCPVYWGPVVDMSITSAAGTAAETIDVELTFPSYGTEELLLTPNFAANGWQDATLVSNDADTVVTNEGADPDQQWVTSTLWSVKDTSGASGPVTVKFTVSGLSVGESFTFSTSVKAFNMPQGASTVEPTDPGQYGQLSFGLLPGGAAVQTFTTIATPAAGFTLTYDYTTNGGDSGPAPDVIQSGDFTVSSTPATKAGKVFLGWNTQADGSGTTRTAGSTITGGQDVTIYAIFTP